MPKFKTTNRTSFRAVDAEEDEEAIAIARAFIRSDIFSVSTRLIGKPSVAACVSRAVFNLGGPAHLDAFVTFCNQNKTLIDVL
jgi:hypothetical protein